jgi:uncharacterized protein YjiS (DUF1127 family)
MMKTTSPTLTQNSAFPSMNPWFKVGWNIESIRHSVKFWKQRSLGRKLLRHLSEQSLRDIGMSKVEAIFEADKPFWKK